MLEQPNISPDRPPGNRPRQGMIRKPSTAALPAPSGPPDGPIALLRAIGVVLRRRKVPLLLWVAGCMLLALLYARTLPPVYTASASLILQSVGQVGAAGQDPISPVTLDLNRVDSELQVIRSERLQSRVFESLGLATTAELQPAPPGLLRRMLPDGKQPRPPPEAEMAFPVQSAAEQARQAAFAQFRDRFSARRIGQSYVIEISYASSDPELAARVANSAASAYLLQSVAFKAGVAANGGEFVQGRLDSLSAQVESAVNAVRAGTLPDAAMPDADARVIGAALRPLSPSAPRPKLIILAGAVLGLLSGLFALSLAAAMDRRLHDGATLEHETTVTRLALIPAEKRLTGRQGDLVVALRPNGACAHALRDLRTAIDLAAFDRTPTEPGTNGRIIALAQWAPGTGCSMVTMNLARLIQTGGQPVTVVDADIHGAGRGLTGWYAPDHGTDTRIDADGIAVLPVSAVRTHAGALSDMRDPGVARMLGHLRAQGDVLLDLPPLCDGAEALALARHADLVVIVAGSRTTFDQVTQAATRLTRLGVPVIGAAVNNAPGTTPEVQATGRAFARLGTPRPGGVRDTARAALASVASASTRPRDKKF
ncbi:MAG TPA: Wzz/FepE/Etk N-terminal domain-containing protein [Paenirhodobacter sp.]